MADQAHEIKNKAFTFLARREHSIYELRCKLEAKDFDALQVDSVIDELIAGNYLSEARYVEMMIRYQFERGQGPNKIRHAFRQNQVDQQLVQQAFDEFKGDWLISAKTLRVKRFGTLCWPEDINERLKEKSRQMRFLANRGFEPHDIESVFKE